MHVYMYTIQFAQHMSADLKKRKCLKSDLQFLGILLHLDESLVR